MKFDAAGISKAGGKKVNEDSYAIFNQPPWACFVVADGLGGHGAGDVASQAAIQAIQSLFKSRPGMSDELVSSYINSAQSEVLRLQKSNPKYRAMRTTVILLVSDGQQARWAHVGDSRLYFFRNGVLSDYTLDQSVPQALVRAGEIPYEQIRFHEDRNRLLQALGSENPPRIELASQPVALGRGDAFLLCSDGFWEWVLEEEMQQDLHKAGSSGKWLELMHKRLLKAAKPGNDNYSAVAVMIS